MSRIGKQPIPLPAGTTVTVNGSDITVSGKNGTLTQTLRPEIAVELVDDGKTVNVNRVNESRSAKALHGLFRALINNMVQGVNQDYTKTLQVNGVGYTAQLKGNTVALKVGYADTREVPVPTGVKVEVNGNIIKVAGPDKQLVGQTAASIRAQRKPEPYNGKGIKYDDEVILRKVGKAFGK
ncbi:MAG: 50S ribosomal protein L6 [Planctomycetota bacterium]